MSIFNAVKMQSGIGFIVDALFGNFAYLHNLYTVVELHINFVLIHTYIHTYRISYYNPNFIQIVGSYTWYAALTLND